MRADRDTQGAVDALAAALRFLGLEVLNGIGVGDRREQDVSITLPGGGTLALEIKSTSLVTGDSGSRQLPQWLDRTAPTGTTVIVADRITADGRERLNEAGCGWLDLRGHLKLVGPGLFIDADVPAMSSPSVVRHGLKGQVGIELAALLLLDPTAQIPVRVAAAKLARAPSSVSDAFSALRAANLVDAKRTPVVPELFWELAEHWKSTWGDVASIPQPNRGRDNSVLHLGLDDVESTSGWALTDTVAAAVYGAPVSMRADHPPEFYVPDQSALRRAVQMLGPAASPAVRAGRIRVAPVPLVCAQRVDGAAWTNEAWPLANPLFVALDLAQDPGRGREILAAWTPRRPWNRVW